MCCSLEKSAVLLTFDEGQDGGKLKPTTIVLMLLHGYLPCGWTSDEPSVLLEAFY